MIKIIVCNTLYISAITHSQNLNETQNQQPVEHSGVSDFAGARIVKAWLVA